MTILQITSSLFSEACQSSRAQLGTRAGVTFKYTEPNDWQTEYVRFFLGFLGIEEVEFVYAEGLALGEKTREEALAAARAGTPARSASPACRLMRHTKEMRPL
jgi:FMN-dependent NADH-azoreductase